MNATRSIGEVIERLHELAKNGNPEYFVIWSDQGVLPHYEVRQNLRLFGEKVMPEFAG